MTVEKVKRRLKSARGLRVRLLTLQRMIDELADEMSGVGAVDYSKVKVKSSPGNSTESRYIKLADRLKDLQNQYNTLFDELNAVEDDLGERMKRLNPTEYQVIYERYLKGIRPFSIRKAADKFGYTEDAIKAIQRRSFKKMADF